MFTLRDTAPDHTCAGRSRRDFLRVGTLGLGGLSLPWLLREKARAAAGQASPLTGKSVVLLFLQGGPPHIETFDPHGDASPEIASATGEIATSLAGIRFGGTFPRLAGMAHKLAVVRSFASKNNGHTYEKVTTGSSPLEASMGAIYSRIAGCNDASTGLPTNCLILPEAVADGLKLENNFESQAMPSLTPAGKLGATYAAFNPSGGGDLKADMQLATPGARLSDRRGLLEQLDGLQRKLERSGELEGIGAYQQQAYEILTRGIASAFDLGKESAKTLARYDTSKLFRLEDWTKFHNMKRSSNQLGKQMLLARRLVEAGAGFVTVSDCGWDLHADGNSAPALDAMYPLGGQVDHAVSAFIEDIEARGMSEEVLLIVTAEMGRSPKRNQRGGRDHYGELTPLLLYGGGLRMGQVIGSSDSRAERPATRPYEPRNLLATVMHVLFNVPQLRLRTDLPREFAELFAYEPIRELI